MALLAWLAPFQTEAQPPAVGSLFPAGARQGSATVVSAEGLQGAWPFQCWTDDAALVFAAAETPGQFNVQVMTSATKGAHFVRFFTREGCTPPHLFVVGDVEEIRETDAGERAGAGEAIATLPLTVNGQLRHPGETDAFLLRLSELEVLHAGVVAVGLDSPLQAQLRLWDPAGQLVGESTNRAFEDAKLAAPIYRTGMHRLTLAQVSDSAEGTGPQPGNPNAYYRLTLNTVFAPPAPTPSASNDPFVIEGPPIPGAASSVLVRKSVESEPMLHPEMLSPTSSLPGLFTGFINPTGDEDRFSFAGEREVLYRFSLRAGSLGSPLLPALRILGSARDVLAEATPDPDPTLEWVAPADGAYLVVVADATGGGGPDFRYELDVAPPQPRLAAAVSGHTFRLSPGEEIELNVELRRPDTHRGLFTVGTVGLPPEVAASGAVITGQGSEVTLRLRAQAGAKPSNQSFRLTLLDTSVVPPRVVVASAAVRGRHVPPGALLRNETEELWLTVLPAD